MTVMQVVSRWFGLPVAAAVVALGAASAQPAPNFEPTVGQPGKDVVWVPTPGTLVEGMLDVANVTSQDFVVDLGSGDGRTVIAAAKRGAKAMGVEYDPAMVELSRRNAAKEGVGERVSFVQGDLFQTDFSGASVVTMFLLPDLNLRLRPLLLDMKPGTRVVSNTFTMGEWAADKTIKATECQQYCTAYLWIVPAKVEGRWRFEGGELNVEQKFQKLTGTVTAGGASAPIADGKVEGEEVSFSAGPTTYRGRLNGNVIEGTRTSGESRAPWRATRA